MCAKLRGIRLFGILAVAAVSGSAHVKPYCFEMVMMYGRQFVYCDAEECHPPESVRERDT